MSIVKDNTSFYQLRKTNVFTSRAESSQDCASGTCDSLSKGVKNQVVVGKFTDMTLKKSVDSFNKIKNVRMGL